MNIGNNKRLKKWWKMFKMMKIGNKDLENNGSFMK